MTPRKNPVILCVDDEPVNLKLLKNILVPRGYEVVTAENGAEALDKLQHEPATIIISDILMPKMDGFQLCRAVKADEALKNIPFIFYTAAYTTEKDRAFALSLGASRFILKPASHTAFINIIHEALQESRSGLLHPGAITMENETAYLKEHQSRLIKKLDDKISELEGSEERYRSLIFCAHDGIVTLDDAGVITSWNGAAERIFGYGADEVIGKQISFLVPGDIRSGRNAILARLKEQALPWSLESVGRSKRGDLIPVGISFSLIADKKGTVLGFSAIIRDITDLKRTERSLAEKEARLRILVETIPDLIWLKDTDGVYLTCNKMFEQLLGAGEHDIVGKTDYDFVGTELADFFREHDRVAMAAGKPISNMEWITYARDGRRALLSTIRTPMYDDEGKLLGVLGIGRDITEYQKLEEQLHHAQKMEGIGTLAGGIAHDFNNILSAIIGYGHVTLMKMPQNDPLRLNIEHMLESADRAATLTQSLLTFSRKQIINRKLVDLNYLLNKVEKFLARVIGEDVAVRLVLAEGELTVFADAGQLEQVFMNLATNARDAMPKGGSFTIETSVAELDSGFVEAHGYGKPGSYAMISVTDTGVGMNDETRVKIFEPFFTTKEIGKGTGLGMAVVYGILKQNDGFINVYSEPGKGTTFRIWLPLIKAAAADGRKALETENPKGGPETILVAEDDPSVRKLTVLVLEQMGYTVITARDGAEAVAKFRENKDRIRLILLDIIMPKKNGGEASDEIRKMMPDIPVLFASGYSADMLRERTLIGEGAALIYKPISPQALLKKVREMLDRKPAAEPLV